MNSQDIKAEIERLSANIAPTVREISRLNGELRKAKSVEFIRANGITKDQVELSDGEGKPHFMIITSFIDWMKQNNCQKRWAEWNTRIYSTSELFGGRMDPEAPGLMEDMA